MRCLRKVNWEYNYQFRQVSPPARPLTWNEETFTGCIFAIFHIWDFHYNLVDRSPECGLKRTK